MRQHRIRQGLLLFFRSRRQKPSSTISAAPTQMAVSARLKWRSASRRRRSRSYRQRSRAKAVEQVAQRAANNQRVSDIVSFCVAFERYIITARITLIPMQYRQRTNAASRRYRQGN